MVFSEAQSDGFIDLGVSIICSVSTIPAQLPSEQLTFQYFSVLDFAKCSVESKWMGDS